MGRAFNHGRDSRGDCLSRIFATAIVIAYRLPASRNNSADPSAQRRRNLSDLQDRIKSASGLNKHTVVAIGRSAASRDRLNISIVVI
jgi:hypothetical protein